MKFRLTYYGPLRATNRDPLEQNADPLSVHKQDVREVFHGQLKELWNTNKFLREEKVGLGFHREFRGTDDLWEGNKTEMYRLHDVMAKWYRSNGFNFLPLVPASFSLLCSLDILFLRRDIPGSTFTAGDVDNRIKTVIDALRPPKKPNEFVGRNKKAIVPKDDQDPFYVLLEDDKQVSHFSVETDTLLDPRVGDDADANKVKLIITVELRPYDVNMFNLSYS